MKHYFQDRTLCLSSNQDLTLVYTRDLVKFFRHRLFQDIFFKMAGSGIALASEDVRSFTVLLSRSKDFVCLFTATEFRSCTASFETTENLETCIFLR